jgi:hypothetical protein
MVNQAVSDMGSKEATFTALAEDFQFDKKVRQLFLDSPMATLEDFRYYFAEEKEVDAFCAAEESLKDAELRIQISRVRRAWAAVRQNGLRKENRNSVSSVAELDDLLEEGTLREIKIHFWKRYKSKYPVEVSPSDQLLSRCHREMDKRLLTVFDIWRVKTLLHQVTTTKKRKQVGTDLYTFEDEAEETSVTHGVEKYLSKLHTYLLALAIAGSTSVEGAPPEEVFGSDSTRLIKVPWDVLQSYYFRAARAAMTVPEASRLAWLESRDISERSVWVSQFREGNEPLGQVVQSIMEKRGAHWDTPIQHMVSQPYAAQQPRQQQPQQHPRATNQRPAPTHEAATPPRRQTQGQQQFSPGSPSKPRTGATAETLRDGKTLCPDFNNNKCDRKGPSCDKGLHKCAKVLRGGRPCGMSYHGAYNCRNV